MIMIIIVMVVTVLRWPPGSALLWLLTDNLEEQINGKKEFSLYSEGDHLGNHIQSLNLLSPNGKNFHRVPRSYFFTLLGPECPPWTIAPLFQSPFKLPSSRRLPLQLWPPDSRFSWACCPCLSVGIKSEDWHLSPWVSFIAMLHFPNKVHGSWAEHVLHRL